MRNNVHSYPPDNHHSSDDVYSNGGVSKTVNTLAICFYTVTQKQLHPSYSLSHHSSAYLTSVHTTLKT